MARSSNNALLALLALLAAAGCSGADAPPVNDGTSRATAWACQDVDVPLGRALECTSRLSDESLARGTADGPAYTCAGGAGTADEPCPPGGGSTSGAHGDAGAPDAGPDPGPFFCTKASGELVCRRAPTCAPGAHPVQMDCDTDASTDVGDGAPSSGGGYPGGGGDGAPSGGQTQCFFTAGSPGGGAPAATVWYALEASPGPKLVHVRLTFTPSFVDNSYGATAVGWRKGHSFAQLVGSDHAELRFVDARAQPKLHFKLDYLSKSAAAPSGYASLGVRGGEGRMLLGDARAITKAVTSLDRNLNERGYRAFLVDSPATDASYARPASAPGWDFRVVYEVWIDEAAFGPGGFGGVALDFVHASPSKVGTNTLSVAPGPCPPGFRP